MLSFLTRLLGSMRSSPVPAELEEANRKLAEEVAAAKRAEQALSDSEALYSSLVNALPMHVTRKDLEGRITFVNQKFCDLLGKRPEEILGKTDYDFYPAELADKYRRDDRRIVETGGVFEDVEENRTGEDVAYFHVLKSAVTDASGKIVGTQAVFWDVTNRKLAEEALDQERYLLHTLLERLPDAIYFKDHSSRFSRISKGLADRLGLDAPEQALGKSDEDFFPEHYWKAAFEDEQELMRTGRSLVGKEEQPQWPDGRKSWVSTTKVPLHDKQGRIVGTFGISRDITELKRAEEALRESQRRTRLIIDTARDAFVAINADGVITDWNAQAELTFGWSREEALGRRLTETIIPPQYREAHRQGIERFLATGEGPMLNERIETTALHRDGREFPAELTISPLHLNETCVFNAFIHDITRRRQAVEAMQMAKEAAEAASRAKSDFLANISHEIRTPMNAILGMTELVLDTSLDTRQRENLRTVQESAESLLSLINDILDFSKIEAGKLSLEKARFALRDSLGDTLKLLAPRADRGNLELVGHIAPDVPDALSGDPGRLRQIIVNLVGNAIKFTERGEVLVDVQCESRSETEAVLHFAVSDTGIGVPREKLAVIFEAFEQADTSTTRRFPGTGLGLAISSTLVELMGGRIWVESEVGRGSTFHFTARLALVPEEKVEAPAVEPSTLRRTRSLVVDDNASNRRILDEMLRHWEMDASTVAGAEAAIEELQRAWRKGQPYDLVLADVNMPEVDGFTLVEWIKQDEDLSSTVIMMLTSGDRPGDVARCDALGVAAYLMKPIKQSELFDAIVLALGGTIAEDTATQTDATKATDRLRPLRVLLAEDSLPNQKLAVALLERQGHTVTVANNGREAVTAVKSGHFELVLMDVQMPEMDGLEATAVIRDQEARSGRHVPIVAMTAHAMKGDREQCLAAGMDDYVAKPVRAKHLYEAIQRVVADAGQSEVPDEALPAVTGSVNWQVALQTVQDDRDLLIDVADAFLEECPMVLEQLEEAIRSADPAGARRAAHTIKGSMRAFGAETAFQQAARIEEMGRSGDLAGAASGLNTLRQQLEAVTNELRAFELMERQAGK